MRENLRLGDVVVLNSGGPTMTVISVDDTSVTATWFGEGKSVQHTGAFPIDAVERPAPQKHEHKVARHRPDA